MSDEPAKLILGDTAISALEGRSSGKRRFFGRRKRQRPPLTHCENCGAQLTGRYCAQCGPMHTHDNVFDASRMGVETSHYRAHLAVIDGYGRFLLIALGFGRNSSRLSRIDNARSLAVCLPSMGQHAPPGDLARPGEETVLLAQLAVRLHHRHRDVLQHVFRVGMIADTEAVGDSS